MVVVSPPPPPPAQQVQAGQSCKYSYRVKYDLYQCYTEQEWQQKVTAENAAAEKSAQDFSNFISGIPTYLLQNWWKLILWALGGLVAFVGLIIIAATIEEKRHPERFINGFYVGERKEWWE